MNAIQHRFIPAPLSSVAAVLTLGLTLAGISLVGVSPTLAQVTDPADIVYPAMPSTEVPQPERVELDNGMVVILLEDHELPLIDARMLVRAGSRWEPAEKIGLANLVGQVLRSGGTRNMASDELDDLLEDRAATLESWVGTSNGGVTMSTLKDDFPEMLRVFAEVLRYPAFEQDKIDVAKTQVTSGIARQNDNAPQIRGREFAELIYGSDSPYARQATYATIDNISRDDLVAFHAEYFHPDRMILGLAGDFDAEQAIRLVREVFGAWPAGPELEEPAVEYRQEPNPGVFHVEKNDITQAFVRIGHLGITRDNPDYYAVEMMNQVLGGSFAARLFTRVRSQKGLAYNVSGRVGSGWDYPGITQLTISTKTETTAAGIDALLEEVHNMTREPPTDDEVSKARSGILNSFVFRADSARRILSQQLTYEYFGYPLDWQERYRDGIESVTTAEVREAAKKYLHPDRFSILVVGKTEGIDRPLSDFGEVQMVDITIPEPPGEAVTITAGGEARGRELIARAVEGIGGAERLDALKTYHSKMSATVENPAGTMILKARAAIVLPDRMRWEVTLPFGTMVQVLNGDDSFSQSPQSTGPLGSSERKELKKSLLRLAPVLLQQRDAAGFKAVATGAGEVEGTKVELVHVELDGDANTLGVDPVTGRILSLAYRGTNFLGAPGKLEQRFSDFREVDGLVLPFASVTTFDGEPMLSGTVESTELDVALEDSEFQKPE